MPLNKTWMALWLHGLWVSIKHKKSFKSTYDIVRPVSPSRPAYVCVCVCVRVCVCISLSSGLSAIITSCGLITTLPKKSHDLKVTVTWHAHFSSHPSPLPSLFLPLWKPWQQPAETGLRHTASFCARGVFRVQVVSGGKMEVGWEISWR